MASCETVAMIGKTTKGEGEHMVSPIGRAERIQCCEAKSHDILIRHSLISMAGHADGEQVHM